MKVFAGLLAALAASTCLAADWPEYRAIIWHPQKPGSCAALREVGIDAGAVIADRERPARLQEAVAPLRDCGLAWYVENIATDFYSAYHRYTPGKPIGWLFLEVRDAHRRNPSDPSVFLRDPSLSDAQWQERIRARLAETVRAHRPYRPLFYNLADEPGIADLSTFWDYDFSPHSLAGLRPWLKTRYGSLAALNAQWGSRFAGWDAVVPMTTAEAIKRPDGNWSAWADFKEWMDAEFARAIELGTRAVHAADPDALAAIEGTQVPGWGGYDYSRLAGAVDVMEPYDLGGNVEIVRSLNPKLVVLITSFGEGPREAHQIWRSLLRGGRGVIFWDPNGAIVGADGRVGARGRDLAPLLREIKGGIGAALIRSERIVAPVAVLYSPASLRAQWMLDWQPKGTAWSDREQKTAYEDESAVRASMTAFFDLLGHAGLEPRVLTPELVDRGALERGVRALVLPRVLALSPAQAGRIRAFAAAGGTVIADGVPGQFDEHLRRLPKPLLADLFAAPGKGRAILLGEAERARLVAILAEAGVAPAFTLERMRGPGGVTNVETYLWRDGGTTILGLQRDRPGAHSEPLRLVLREPARVVDLRGGRDFGTVRTLELSLDPVAPTLLSLSRGDRQPHASP